MDSIFHEKQEGALCAQHCLNSLLQGAYFTAVDLASFAASLDNAEREHMAEGDVNSPEFLQFMREPSSNMDDSGYFSIQVIARALTVWNLELVPYNSAVAAPARANPLSQRAFICNLQNHWFTIRRLGPRQWFNLNSLKTYPELISDTYLSLYLGQLQIEGYSIFVVDGDLPACEADEVLTMCPMTTDDVAAYDRRIMRERKEAKSQSETAVVAPVDDTPAVLADPDDVRRRRMKYFDSLQNPGGSSGGGGEDTDATAEVLSGNTDSMNTGALSTDDMSEEEMLQVALAMSMENS